MGFLQKVFILCVFCCCIANSVAEEESCNDIDGIIVEHGLLYVPGPNVCTQCVCHHSEPKWCQTMFCNGPPYMCKNYKVGKTCCQFECLDPPTEKPPPSLKEMKSLRSRGYLITPCSILIVLSYTFSLIRIT